MESKETEKQKYSGFDSIYNHLPHISSEYLNNFSFKNSINLARDEVHLRLALELNS